jgi:hypothetical protein
VSTPNPTTTPKFSPPPGLSTADEKGHVDVSAEEWTFEWWSNDGDLAGAAIYRFDRHPKIFDYAWGMYRKSHPLLHVVQGGIRRRTIELLAKAPGFWAEFTCESAFEQWTIGNETHAVEFDDPDEALGRGFGRVVPMASDLEWYATAEPEPIVHGYRQVGVILGDVETHIDVVKIDEMQSVRTHRWITGGKLESVWTPAPPAHFVARLPVRFEAGPTFDLVLTPDGWAERN